MLTVNEVVEDQSREGEVSAAADRGDAGSARRLAIAASFAVPAALVAALIVALISVRDGAEAAVANVARLLPLGYAFGAGMVAKECHSTKGLRERRVKEPLTGTV